MGSRPWWILAGIEGCFQAKIKKQLYEQHIGNAHTSPSCFVCQLYEANALHPTSRECNMTPGRQESDLEPTFPTIQASFHGLGLPSGHLQALSTPCLTPDSNSSSLSQMCRGSGAKRRAWRGDSPVSPSWCQDPPNPLQTYFLSPNLHTRQPRRTRQCSSFAVEDTIGL